MQSINFDKGYKTYAVNEDESNVVKINVADLNMKFRIEELPSRIALLEEKYKDVKDPTSRQCKEADSEVRKEINYAFGTDVCTPAFGLLNCLTILADSGKSVAQSFIEALMPIIKRDIDEYTEKIKNLDTEKIAKYLG